MSRINRVTTATGDNGTTALGTGRRVSKTDPIITALGSVDELSSLLGILRNHQINDELTAQLIDIQQALFDLGAILAMEGQYQAEQMDQRIDTLKSVTDTCNGTLPPLREFVIPGSSQTNAQCHLCRTVCRRAEANVWEALEAATNLSEDSAKAFTQAGRYLNRLSDFLFVQARILADNPNEPQWRGPKWQA